jgi:hypothetical protein
MNSLEFAAVIGVALWLGLLTLTAMLTIRQVALVTARIDQTGAPQYIDDGPALQSRLPDEVIRLVPELDSGITSLLLMSASCTPCKQLAEGLEQNMLPAGVSAIALVPGKQDLADDIAELLPPSIQMIRDPAATEVAHALDFQRVPAAIIIERGRVVAKAPPAAVSSAGELVNFMVQSSSTPSVSMLVST